MVSLAWLGTPDTTPFWPHLVTVQGDGRQRQRRDVQGAVLGEAAHMAHALPEHPCAVHEAGLGRGGYCLPTAPHVPPDHSQEPSGRAASLG